MNYEPKLKPVAGERTNPTKLNFKLLDLPPTSPRLMPEALAERGSTGSAALAEAFADVQPVRGWGINE